MGRMDWMRNNKMTCEMFKVIDDGSSEGKTILDEPKVEVVETFKASSYEDAIAHAAKYREAHSDYPCSYFWRQKHSFGDYGLWHCDGICSWSASDVDNVFIDWIARTRVKMRKDKENWANHICWVKKIARIRRMSACKVIRGMIWLWLKIWDCLSWCFWERPSDAFKDWRWGRRNLKNWKKTGHSLDECWALEMHMLRDLKYNLKTLNETGCAINTKFMYDVLRDRHPTESDDEIENRMSQIMMNANGDESYEVERLAVKKQKATYDHICHLVDLYTFYVNQEIDDKEPTMENLTDDMHFYLIEGTYNMLDYKKMMDESKKVWNEIWDLVKKYGQQMGD